MGWKLGGKAGWNMEGVASPSRTHLAGRHRQQGDSRPLPKAEWLQQLLLSVFKRWTDDINRGSRQNELPAGLQPPRLQSTAKSLRGSTELRPYSDRVPHQATRVSTQRCTSSASISRYSYRNASTGSSLDARSAGTIPLTTPTSNNTPVESRTVINEICR